VVNVGQRLLHLPVHQTPALKSRSRTRNRLLTVRRTHIAVTSFSRETSAAPFSGPSRSSVVDRHRSRSLICGHALPRSACVEVLPAAGTTMCPGASPVSVLAAVCSDVETLLLISSLRSRRFEGSRNAPASRRDPAECPCQSPCHKSCCTRVDVCSLNRVGVQIAITRSTAYPFPMTQR